MTDKDKPGEAHDAAVLDSREAADADFDILAKDSTANNGGFQQVEGHGWTKEQLEERAENEKREREEAKAYAKTNEEERKRLNLPEPREQTKEEKKSEEITKRVDAAVEAFNGGGVTVITGVQTAAPTDAQIKKAREGTKHSRAQHVPVQGVNDKHVPQDPSTKVLLHPDTPQVGPADPPKDLANRTGSLSNLLPRGQAGTTSEDTGPTSADLADAHAILERSEASSQDTNPQPQIKSDVEDLEFPASVVAETPTAEDSSKPPSKSKSKAKAPAKKPAASASKPAPKGPEMTTGAQTATQTATTESTSTPPQKSDNN